MVSEMTSRRTDSVQSRGQEVLLAEISGTLKDLLIWTKFAGMQQLRIILTQVLKTDTEYLVYELSDGSRGTRDIANLAGLGSNSTVASYWKKWSKLGIVTSSHEHEGRFQHICSLEEIGISVPELPKTVQSEQLSDQQPEGELSA